MKLNKISKILFLSIMILPMIAGAEVLPAPPNVPLNVNTFLGILDTAVRWLFSIFMIFAVIMLLIAAFKYLTSGGDSGRVSEANKSVIFAVVAIAVALLSGGVRSLVESFLNIGSG